MTKFKPAKGKQRKGGAKSARGAVPCIIIVIAVIALISLLFALALRSST